MRILFLNWAPIIKYGIAQGFLQAGCDISIIEPSEDNYEGMMDHIKRFKPDYLFTEGGINRESYILPVIRDSGVPHIYWAIEDPVSFNLSLTYGKESILVGTTCIEWIEQIYKPAKVNSISLPFACNPEWHKNGKFNSKLSHKLSFMGNNYEAHNYRKKGYDVVFKPLIEQKEDIVFYGGNEWIDKTKTFHIKKNMYKGYLAYEELPSLCASSDFILGVNSINNSETMQSMRTFEVLGCAGFYLTHYSTAIENMFENHKHLIWTESPEETIEIVRFYENKEDLRQKIIQEGQKFVYENHTYKHRAIDIIEELKKIQK